MLVTRAALERYSWIVLHWLFNTRTEPHVTLWRWLGILGDKIAANPWKSAALFGAIGTAGTTAFQTGALAEGWDVILEMGRAHADYERSLAELNRAPIEAKYGAQ